MIINMKKWPHKSQLMSKIWDKTSKRFTVYVVQEHTFCSQLQYSPLYTYMTAVWTELFFSQLRGALKESLSVSMLFSCYSGSNFHSQMIDSRRKITYSWFLPHDAGLNCSLTGEHPWLPQLHTLALCDSFALCSECWTMQLQSVTAIYFWSHQSS